MISLLSYYKSSDLSPRLRRSLAILGKGKTALETFLKRDSVAVGDHLLGEWLVTFKDQSVSLSYLLSYHFIILLSSLALGKRLVTFKDQSISLSYLCPSISHGCHQYSELNAKLKFK